VKSTNGPVLLNENIVNGNKTCEIYMNDVFIEKLEEIFKDNPSVQIEISIIPKNEEKNMKTNLKKLHVQKQF
jgi:hypothetical protein